MFQKSIVRMLNDMPIPLGFKDAVSGQRKGAKIDIQKNERALLGCLLAFIQQCDPDVLVGHNFIGFGLDVLLHRLKFYKMDAVWSKLGRLRRNK